jgi:hypothetical protein
MGVERWHFLRFGLLMEPLVVGSCQSESKSVGTKLNGVPMESLWRTEEAAVIAAYLVDTTRTKSAP